MKKIWILTLFPDYFTPFINLGVIGQALSKERIDKKIEVITLNIRDYALDKHKTVDDYPFGGGPGMVMRVDVLHEAFMAGVVNGGGYGENFKERLHVVYTSPRGDIWNQDLASLFEKKYIEDESGKDLVFICGRYEGVDERFLKNYVNEHISIGDFVLTGGELAVMSILDSILRLHRSVLGNDLSALDESFSNDLLEFPQYTKPRDFNGDVVPEILLSGHHANIAKYRLNERIEITKKIRPDLYTKYMKGKK